MSKRASFVLQALFVAFIAACLPQSAAAATRFVEYLDRGLVAVSTGANSNFVSWRLFGTDPASIAFDLYRDGVKINPSPITNSTNYTDNGGSLNSSYQVVPIVNGLEQLPTPPVGVWSTNYLSIPLNIPAGGTTPDGVNYTYSANDCSVGDLDNDGQYEIVLKWDPSNSKDNSHSGYTGSVYLDAYELDGAQLWRIDLGRNIRAGAHYTQFIVYDLDSDGDAEVACRTADGTVDGVGAVIGDPNADYRNTSGYIITGPEFLTIFDGRTGAALVTTDFTPDRVHVSQWGDGYGNRCDRFLAGVAYLDGRRPSLIMARGYYSPQGGYSARNEITAWDWRDGILTRRWWFKAHTSGPNANYIGQGTHSLSVADVDADGLDEIIYGACTIDHDGSPLYSTGLGHGDALHVSDLDPARPGLEVFQIHEGTYNPGASFRDAATGQVLWQTANADVGRGVSADIDPAWPGAECWGFGGLRSCTGETISSSSPASTNFLAWWDGDLVRELLNSNVITKHGGSTLLTASGCSSNNGTKSTPGLSADLLGDWREEVIWRTTDSRYLRLYTTTTPTAHRLYTLMHDTQYRVAVAWQNTAYNQPPHPSFFIGHNMAAPPTPDIALAGRPGLPGDLSGNGYVDLEDFAVFATFWQITDCALDTAIDTNDDCTVNLLDLADFVSAWLTGVWPGTVSTLRIQENEPGFVSVLGTIDSNHAGYTGDGFCNTNNELHADIAWAVSVPAAGPYTLRWRYANGTTANRAGYLTVNGVEQIPVVDLPGTGAWDAWAVTPDYSLTLSPGAHTLRLAADTSDGLPNIDYIEITGSSPTPGN